MKTILRYVQIVIICIIASALTATASDTRQITDMGGRTVTIPDQIKRVYAPSPYGSYILHSIVPDLMAGLIFPLKEEDKLFLNPAVQNLPVIGGLSGQGVTANMEVLLTMKPDLLLMWGGRNVFRDTASEPIKKLGVPYVYATVDSMVDYPAVYTFLGKLFKRQERAARLAAYCRTTLSEVEKVVSRIPPERRPLVYYAEGADGLASECDDSIHVEILRRAGDKNALRCHTSNHKGFEKVSLEQVIMYNPDVIIAQEKVFYEKVKSSPAWRNVKAVKNGRVYLVPHVPFNWFDRPPSFMRFLGLKWVMSCLYPKEYPVDIINEAREFYKLFLGSNVSENDMKKIVGGNL